MNKILPSFEPELNVVDLFRIFDFWKHSFERAAATQEQVEFLGKACFPLLADSLCLHLLRCLTYDLVIRDEEHLNILRFSVAT